MSKNYNLKLYVHNINKTSQKEYYYQSSQVYLKEIYNINKKITEEGVPIEELIDEIKYIKSKYNIFKNKDKSNAYLTLVNLENTATYKKDLNTYKQLYTDASNTLVETNIELTNALKELDDCKKNCNNVSNGFRIKDVALNINTAFNTEYIYYIKDYGMPFDGVFLEPILKYIRDVYNLV